MIGINNKKNKIILQIFIMILSSILLLNSLTSSEESIKNIYSYNLQKNATYRVHLKNNDFYESEFVESGKSYLSNLTDYINIDFNYAFNSSKKSDVNITYDVIAHIDVAHSSNAQIVWTKDYEIIKDKSLTNNSNSVSINENIDLDFEEYNSVVKEFKNQFQVPITATLTVKFIVNNNVDLLQKTNDKNSVIELKMNLDTDVFSITEKNVGSTSNTIYLNNTEFTDNKSAIPTVLLSIVFLISFVSLLSMVFKGKSIPTTSEYSKTINKILRNYGDIVAEIVKPVDLSNLEIIDVKNFDQILDVEEELRMPILFSEDKRNEEGCFVIIHNNIAYRYILRNKKRRRIIE